MRYLSFFLLFAISCTCYGQSDFRKGYIVNQAGEKIFGEIDYRSNKNNIISCLFKDESGEITKYFPGREIIGYGFLDDKFYTSQIKEGFFVEVLVQGDLSLYKFKDIFYITKEDSIYILESKKEIKEIGNRRILQDTKWKGVISFLMSDCKTQTLKRGDSFSEKTLSRIVTSYNQCKGSDFKTYKSKKPWGLYQYGVSFGFNRSSLKVRTPLYSFFNSTFTSYDPSIGVTLKFASPRINENLAFKSGIHYLKSNYYTVESSEGLTSNYFYDSYLSRSLLSIPLSIEYAFYGGSFSPFFSAGVNIDRILKTEAKIIEESVLDNVVSTQEYDGFTFNRTQLGAVVEVGVKKNYSTFTGAISLNYSILSDTDKASQILVETNRFAINMTLIR